MTGWLAAWMSACMSVKMTLQVYHHVTDERIAMVGVFLAYNYVRMSRFKI